MKGIRDLCQQYVAWLSLYSPFPSFYYQPAPSLQVRLPAHKNQHRQTTKSSLLRSPVPTFVMEDRCHRAVSTEVALAVTEKILRLPSIGKMFSRKRAAFISYCITWDLLSSEAFIS